MAALISFLIANLITSWIGSLLFSGEHAFAIHKSKLVTFFAFFVGYCIIVGILYLTK